MRSHFTTTNVPATDDDDEDDHHHIVKYLITELMTFFAFPFYTSRKYCAVAMSFYNSVETLSRNIIRTEMLNNVN